MAQIKDRYRLAKLEFRPAQGYALQVYAEVNPFEIKQVRAPDIECRVNELNVDMRRLEAFLRNKTAAKFANDKENLIQLRNAFSRLIRTLQTVEGIGFRSAVEELLNLEGTFRSLDDSARYKEVVYRVSHKYISKEYEKITITAVRENEAEEALTQARGQTDAIGGQMVNQLIPEIEGGAESGENKRARARIRAGRLLEQIANNLRPTESTPQRIVNIIVDAMRTTANSLQDRGHADLHLTQR